MQFSGPGGKTRSSKGKQGNFVDCWQYLGMDEFLSSRGKEIKGRVANFAEAVNPVLMSYFENAEFPHQLIPDVAALGISAADMPVEIGGKGLGVTDAGSFMYELARKDAGMATFYLLHHSLGQYTVYKLAQQELRDKILADTIPLKKVLCWALTEPDTGSDASNITTTARKVQGGYLINGRKRWIGNGTFADYVCLWARNESDGNRIQCFLVRKGQKGFTTSKIERKMSLRIAQNADMVLKDVFVPDNERFELARDFASGTKEVLLHSRIYVAWMAAGMAAGACEAAMKYCKERVQFGVPIGSMQMIQAKLVKCQALVQQSILLCMQISRLYDRGEMTIGRIAMAKAQCTANCREAAQLAREAMGGNGILIENQAIKALIDIEAIHTYEGSHEINTLVAGREMTGLSAIRR